MKIKSFHCQAGFSLLEIVVTLIVAAILGSMIYVYFASSLSHSVLTITKLKQSLTLHAIMENITADYGSPSIAALADLQAKVGSEDPNNTKSIYSSDPADSRQHYYVIQNRFIKFVSGSESSISIGDPENLLKITIRNEGGALTALFTSK